MAEFIDIVFDGPPGPVCGRFVESEGPNGASIKAGEWIDRGDGLWALRIPDHSADMEAIDQITNILAAPEWSGADFLEWIADEIGKVRPHPGGYSTRKAYAEVFADATGRDVIEEDED